MRALLVAFIVAFVVPAFALDPRYIDGPAQRNADGSIKRSSAAVYAFRKDHPCPATGLTTGACAGFAIDHVIPLVCGGVDAEVNMQWLPNQIKSAPGLYAKDRWEQRVYCRR